MCTIKISQFNKEALSLFSEAKKEFQKSSIAQLREKASIVPTKFVDEDKKIRIVFAGQYSAGKSSILSYLTGKKLAVGQGITTSECNFIDWNGIEVVDTPGIHTQKRPDHDAITYKAMAEADLIVFGCTVEGFSKGLGKHFRKLLVDKGKGNEMMLVFNKFESSKYGTKEEGRKEFYEKDVLPVISPEFSGEDLFISYIDTYAYEDALDSEGKEREDLLEISGYPEFFKQINKFVEKKKLLGKCTTSLYRLEQILSEAMSNFKSGDTVKDASLELLNQQRNILLESKENIKSKAYSISREKAQQIRIWGDDIANDLSSSDSEGIINSKLQTKYEATNNTYKDLLESLKLIIKEENNSLTNKITNMGNSEFVKNLESEIKKKCENIHISNKMHTKLEKTSNIAANAGKVISNFAKGSNAKDGWKAVFKLANYSGSDAHQKILEIGQFVGYKFKPWEAVKLASKIGKFGKILGVGGSLLGVALQIWDDKQQEDMEKQLIEYRGQIRNAFNDAANVIEMKFDEDTQTWIESNISTKIKDIDNSINSIESTSIIEQKEYEKYHQLLQSTRDLINEIQGNLR